MNELAKRLLMLGMQGVFLTGADGHIWINYDNEVNDWLSFQEKLLKFNITFNSKIYGGVLEALDTIDYTLRLMGEPSLLEQWVGYGYNIMFLGEKGPDYSRVNRGGCGLDN